MATGLHVRKGATASPRARAPRPAAVSGYNALRVDFSDLPQRQWIPL